MSKVTWNDIQTATQSELKKTYKLTDRQLETSIRKHIEGANASERRNEYKKFYNRKGD